MVAVRRAATLIALQVSAERKAVEADWNAGSSLAAELLGGSSDTAVARAPRRPARGQPRRAARGDADRLALGERGRRAGLPRRRRRLRPRGAGADAST